MKTGSGEALRQALRGSLACCGAVELAEAVVADILDCTWLRLQRSAVAEVYRGLALLERYATQMTAEDARERGMLHRSSHITQIHI